MFYCFLLPFFPVRKESLHFLADISIASVACDRHGLIYVPLSVVRGDVGMAAVGWNWKKGNSGIEL